MAVFVEEEYNPKPRKTGGGKKNSKAADLLNHGGEIEVRRS